MPSKPRDDVLQVYVDKASMDRCISRLKGDVASITKAVVRTVNKTAVFGKTQIVHTLQGALNLKTSLLRGGKDIKGYIYVKNATQKRWQAEVHIRGTRIPLLAFGARQTAKGVTYQVKRGGARQLLRHGFINVGTSSGKELVLLRVGEPRPPLRVLHGGTPSGAMVRPRYPIWKQYGPSLTQIMQKLPEYARGVVERTMAERMAMELDRQVQVILDRKDQKKAG